jgi:hypothetical protein
MEVNDWFSLNQTNGLDLSIQTEQTEGQQVGNIIVGS